MESLDDLSRFRFHTGATLTRVGPDDPCPQVLFRDLGPVALAEHLRAPLGRLAGPYTPLLYMRTAEYQEPYVDYEDIGRIVFLRPRATRPWFSGVPHVYVARATCSVESQYLGYVPPGRDLRAVVDLDLRDSAELREALGGCRFDEEVAEALARLDKLNTDLAITERLAEPLRRRLQSRWKDEREVARAEMDRIGLSEQDLCAAWHHLPRHRRNVVREALTSLVRRE